MLPSGVMARSTSGTGPTSRGSADGGVATAYAAPGGLSPFRGSLSISVKREIQPIIHDLPQSADPKRCQEDYEAQLTSTPGELGP